MPKKKEKVTCHACKGERNHEIVREISVSQTSDEDSSDFIMVTYYQIVKCLGCDSISFRQVLVEVLPEGETVLEQEKYPVWLQDFKEEIEWSSTVPDEIRNIYSQTIKAYNHKLSILCAAGIRAIVEGCCQAFNVGGNNLERKIEGLFEKKLIGIPQKDTLHELRYMGNEAIHELSPIPQEDLRTGLEIAERLLQMFFEHRNKKLSKRRKVKV